MRAEHNSILRCLSRDQANFFSEIATFGIPLYHFIIRPILHNITKYTPSLLKLIGFVIFFKLLGIIDMVAIEIIGHLESQNVTCMFNDNIEVVMSLNYYWSIVPLISNANGNLFFSCY